jgi:hypothetical protein
MRINSIIRGDDDAITTFSDTQHSADIQLAQIAIQDEINSIVSERMLPYEHTTGTVTLVAGQRVYNLASNFIRFFGQPSFYDATDNRRLYEVNGGEKALMNTDYLYKTTTGTPISFYWDNTTTKSVGFYNIPQTSYSGRQLDYDYLKSVQVSNASDTMPFPNNDEFYAFCQMAARRMKFMISGDNPGLLVQDSGYTNAKTTLYGLIRPADPRGNYGKRYC